MQSDWTIRHLTIKAELVSWSKR